MLENRTIVKLCLILLVCSSLGLGADKPSGDTTYTYSYQATGLSDFGFYKASETTEPYPAASKSEIHNIIFCIGDGMGLGQISLARLQAAGPDGKLHMERMPVTGMVRTHSADALVTDSAAAATALSCGIKTHNRVIGQDALMNPYQTILEACQEKGMRTGLVATSRITHATPASFGAHVRSRKMEAEIAEQLIANRVHILFGGGRDYFISQSIEGSKREDAIDLLTKARGQGYQYVETAEELAEVQGDYVLGLFQMGELTTRDPEPSLVDMTRKAIELLSVDDKGFFLMVEGSQIDTGGHRNDAETLIRQTLIFDLAIKEAMDFAQKNRHTLVVVTADHETGGLMILKGPESKGWGLNWATKSHSAMPVPIYGYGPGAEKFSGTLDNTKIPCAMAGLLGICPFPKKMP